MIRTTLSRRNFLKRFSSLSLGASAVYSPYGLSANNKQKIGVALVGLGYYSTDLLAPALQLTQYCELRGIVSGSPSKVASWQKKYGIKDANVYNYENMHQVANNPDIDVIYIVTPTSLHKDHCTIAANAGKHVWCEKPMAMTVEECSQIMAVCDKNKVQLTIGYRMHHEPNTQTVMQYVKSKPYGEISAVISESGYEGGAPSPDSWRLKRNMGGGALYDMGVYPINGAAYATGRQPIAVTARHEVLRPKVFTEVDESTYLTLYYANGLQAECAASVGKNMNRLRVTCKKGWYELSPMQTYTGVKGVTSDGIALDKKIASQQAAQMDNDALAIINKTAPLVPGIIGLRDIAVVQAALKSAAKKGEKVPV